MSVVLRAPAGSLIQYTKGAPDEVLALCETIWTASGEKPMTKAWKTRILAENSGMANRALRVLCAARRSWSEMPASTEPGDLEQHLCYIGLSGMIDPIRPEVRDAIAECRQAGIRLF